MLEKHGAYAGTWRIRGRQVMRKLGPIHQPGSRPAPDWNLNWNLAPPPMVSRTVGCEFWPGLPRLIVGQLSPATASPGVISPVGLPSSGQPGYGAPAAPPKLVDIRRRISELAADLA
jgi:hypothetical protein